MRNELDRTEPIKLDNGWSGHVLVRSGRGDVGTPDALPLPTRIEWTQWLGQLTTGSSSLSGYAVLKYSRTGEVCRATLPVGDGALDVICKQSRSHGWRTLARVFRQSRARRNFDRAVILLRAGINTARPLALLERGFPSAEAWLISEYVPDLVDLDHIALRRLSEVAPDRKYLVKRGILLAVMDLFDRLRQHNLSHRDLKASNILLRHWDGDGAPASAWLVDVDGLGGGGRRQVRCRKQLVRLAASLRTYESVTRTDYGRFLKRCPLHADETADWRQTFRDLAEQAAGYDTSSIRRKTHKIDGYSGDANR